MKAQALWKDAGHIKFLKGVVSEGLLSLADVLTESVFGSLSACCGQVFASPSTPASHPHPAIQPKNLTSFPHGAASFMEAFIESD